MNNSDTDSLPPMAKLFSKPGTWTQGTLARDASGITTAPLSVTAVSFCLFGAAEFCYHNDGANEKAMKLEQYFNTRFNKTTPKWNDKPGRTQAEVCDVCAKLGI